MVVNTPIRGFLIGWCIAALLGGTSVLWLMWRARLRPAVILLWFAAIVGALLVGSKLLYVIEAWPALRTRQVDWMALLLSPQLRLPGGFVLAVAIGPPLARYLRMPYLRFADTIIPAAGLLIFGIRIGCFLEGCCFGTPSALPWAVRFPASWPPTEVFTWQMMHVALPVGSSTTLPVHPLQLYFALVGIALFVGLSAYAPHTRYDGELLLLFSLTYLWSTWLLEFLRAQPHDLARHVVLVAAVALTAVAATAERRLCLGRRPHRVLACE
jgi:phosphatidylglycerol:prolipoprotein diacylglycerol transferase